jgi:hypothetical protein
MRATGLRPRGERVPRLLLILALGQACALALGLAGAATQGAPVALPLGAPAPATQEAEGEVTEREEWFYRQREYPSAVIRPGAYLRASEQAEALAGRTSAAEAVDTPLSWSELGPRPVSSLAYSLVTPAQSPNWNRDYPWYGRAPLSGRVSAIATHPTDEDTVYAGGAYGGIWKTTTGGTAWQPVFEDQPSLAIGAIAIDPQDPETVYAGTGEANFASRLSATGTPYLSAGLFRSENGGGMWTKLVDPDVDFDSCYFADLVVKPGDSNTLLAAVHGAASLGISTTCQQGVYRSVNGGQDWEKVTSGTGRPADLVVDPVDPTVWYLSFSNGFGVYKSTQSGTAGSWQLASTGLGICGSPPCAGIGRIALAIAPSDPDRLYAAITNSTTNDLLGIFRTANGAGAWEAVEALPGTDSPGVGSFCRRQCYYDIVLSVDPDDPTVFYAGGVRLYRYTGSGTSFGGGPIGFGTTLAPNSIHVDFHALTLDADGRLWIGNDGGVYRRELNGNLTNLNDGLGLIQFYPGIDGKANDRLVGGAQDNGVSRYDGIPEWTSLLGADGGFSTIHPSDRDVIVGTTQELSIYRSVDGGATMQYAGPGCGQAWVGPLNDKGPVRPSTPCSSSRRSSSTRTPSAPVAFTPARLGSGAPRPTG